MPIFLYTCPEGHETEFLKLKKRDHTPKYCKHLVNYTAHFTDECGLPLKRKKIATTNWQYVRGKNPNWPVTTEGEGE